MEQGPPTNRGEGRRSGPRHRDIDRDTQKHRYRNTCTQRYTNIETHTQEINRHTQIQRYSNTATQTYREIHRHIDTETDKGKHIHNTVTQTQKHRAIQ